MYRFGQAEVDAVAELATSQRLWRHMAGSKSSQFEHAFADRIGVDHALVMTSGTAALICGLVAVGVAPGDEVLLPAYTFVATAFAVMAIGATPVLVEVDESLTIDPEDLSSKITDRSRAVIPVHINGLPCAMDAIVDICRDRHLAIVEDACQAVGGTYRGVPLGSIGDCGAFSFNYYKTISCGEGGCLTTGSAHLYERARIYHDAGCAFFSPDQAVRTEYFAGANYRMSEILSAVLMVQLGRLDGILSDLRERKRIVLHRLESVDSVRPAPVRDADGDCGVKSAFLLESTDAARDATRRINEARLCVTAECPLDTSRHVYVNWEAVLSGRSPLSSAIPGRQYAADACPRTLDHLGRTLNLIVHPDTDLRDLDRALATVRGML